MKVCKTCGVEKPLTEYYIVNDKRSNTSYHYTECKKCYNARPQPLSSKQATWVRTLRNRAVAKGIPFEIDVKYVRSILPEDMICPVLGIKMEHGDCDEHGRNNSPSIDKIDPAKGYVKGNVQVISKLANSMKQNATPEELIKFAEWVMRTYT